MLSYEGNQCPVGEAYVTTCRVSRAKLHSQTEYTTKGEL